MILLTAAAAAAYQFFVRPQEIIDAYFASPSNDSPIILFKSENPGVNLDGAIFFLETSGRVFHTPKELCAVESAARHNPGRTVVMGTSSSYLLNTPVHVAVASRHKNVHFVRFNFSSLALKTPLKNWLVDRADHPLRKSRTGVEHLSDIMRVVVVYVFGGIYMDTDMIVLKSLNSIENAIPLAYHVPGDEITNPAMVAMDKGHIFLRKYLEDVRLRYFIHFLLNNQPIMGIFIFLNLSLQLRPKWGIHLSWPGNNP